MGLQMPRSLKPDNPGATLRPDGREPFVAPIEPVRMSKTADATVESVPSPQRLAVDIRNVSLTFETSDGKVDALANVSLQIADGEFVSFIGPSGCGKTTMLRVIADLQPPTTGTLLVNGVSAEQARLERWYGYVFQAPVNIVGVEARSSTALRGRRLETLRSAMPERPANGGRFVNWRFVSRLRIWSVPERNSR